MKKEPALFRPKVLIILVFFLALLGFAPHASAADNVSGPAPERVVREGIAVEFSYEPAGKRDGGKTGFRDFVHLSLRVEGR